MVDNELKELAALALRNAFYEKFSGLVNTYLEASEGLIENQETRISEMTSVFGRNSDIQSDEKPNIWTDQKASPLWTSCGHLTLLEAFEMNNADRIGLNGNIIFERITDGEWFFVGDEVDIPEELV